VFEDFGATDYMNFGIGYFMNQEDKRQDRLAEERLYNNRLAVTQVQADTQRRIAEQKTAATVSQEDAKLKMYNTVGLLAVAFLSVVLFVRLKK